MSYYPLNIGSEFWSLYIVPIDGFKLLLSELIYQNTNK